MTDKRDKQPEEPPRPGSVSNWAELTLTHRCNQRCFFCYEEGRDIAREPPMEEVRRILEDTAKRADQAVLCGKEVLLRPDVLDIVSYGRSLGMRVVVFTNGQALDAPGFVEQLVQAGCDSLTISVHFPDAETFARGARVPEAGFHRQMQGIAEVGKYNREHPQRPIGVSTETDMSALNIGRLAEMRQILIDRLGTTGWNMRLANLLPAHIYDIGLDFSLDSTKVRSRELKDFIKSHPPELPLAFVKVALCLLPEGQQHMSLETEYLRKGTVLTLNHQQIDTVTFDTDSVSRSRDVLGLMELHPYRWICRSCPLAPLCRFERVAWAYPCFLPRQSLKPLALTHLTPQQVLERSGPAPEAVAYAEGVGKQLAGIRYPEEELLDALRQEGTNKPVLGDAWADGDPLLVARLAFDGQEIDVRFESPFRRRGEERILGSLMRGWSVSLLTRDLPSDRSLALLRAIERLPLPDVRRFREGPVYHRETAQLLETAYARLGSRLWPGHGQIAGWTTTEMRLREDHFLDISLLAADGSRGLLVFETRTEAGEPGAFDPASTPVRLRLLPFLEGPKPSPASWRKLLEELAIAVGDGKVDALARLDVVGSFETPLRLDNGIWGTEGPGQPGSSDSPVTQGSQTPHLRIVMTSSSGKEVLFSVAPASLSTPWFKKVGSLAFWYSGDLQETDAQVFARVIMEAMKHLDDRLLDGDAVPGWTETIRQILSHNRMEDRYEFAVSWSL